MAQQDDNLNEDQKEMLQNIDDLDLDALQIDDNATEEQELGAEEIMLSAQEMQAQLDTFAQNEEMDTIDTTAGETVAELDPELAEILEKSEQEPEPQEPEENENEEEDGDLDSLFEPPNTPEANDSTEPPHVEESPQSPEPGNEQASSNPQAPADDPEDALDSDEIGSLIDQAFAEDTQIIPAPSKASPRPEDLAPDQATQEPASTNASPTNTASIQEVDTEPRDEANDIVEKEINAEAKDNANNTNATPNDPPQEPIAVEEFNFTSQKSAYAQPKKSARRFTPKPQSKKLKKILITVGVALGGVLFVTAIVFKPWVTEPASQAEYTTQAIEPALEEPATPKADTIPKASTAPKPDTATKSIMVHTQAKPTQLYHTRIPQITCKTQQDALTIRFDLDIYAKNMQNRERILQITPEIKVLIQNIFYLKTSKMLKKQILESEIQNQLDFLFPEGGIFKVQINNLESEPLDS